MTYRELLQLNPQLADMTDSIPPELDGQFLLRTFGPHELIHQKNSVLTRVGILLSGSFRVVNELENGNIFMIEENDPIAFTGEVALLSGAGVTSVTIETVTRCLIAFLPVKIFDEWLSRDIRLLRYVSRLVANKLYSTSYHRGERMFYSARYILLKYILENLGSGASPQILKKTRQQMSEEIGMAVNTINRVLLGFRSDGLITMNKGKITLTAEQLAAARASLGVYISENRNGAR